MCTAKAIDREPVEVAANWLKENGHTVTIGRTVGLKHGPFAGTDEERALELSQFLQDETIDAIWMARGGYGTIRVMDHMDLNLFSRFPKPIIGFSDVTALHAYLNTRLGIHTVHSFMPVQFESVSIESKKSLLHYIQNEKLEYTWTSAEKGRPGYTEGILTGGNLSVLASLSGTRFDWDPRGKILFLEEVDEWVYHIDRMLQTLHLSDKLQGLAGIILGSWTLIQDNDPPFGETVPEIIKRLSGHSNIPVAVGFPAGHQDENMTIPLGKMASMSVSEGQSALNII